MTDMNETNIDSFEHSGHIYPLTGFSLGMSEDQQNILVSLDREDGSAETVLSLSRANFIQFSLACAEYARYILLYTDV